MSKEFSYGGRRFFKIGNQYKSEDEVSEFLRTTLPSGNKKKLTRFRKALTGPFTCCYCQATLSKEQMTLEHVIPEVIVQASFGKLNHIFDFACHHCNTTTNRIPSCLGEIWSSIDINQIKSASRYLCNLVRNPCI